MRLGQHFLVDKRVAKYMVDALDPKKTETIVEIGPGKGIITQILSQRAKKVIAIEKDRSLEKDLKNLPSNVQIIWKDALEGIPHCDKIISNVPFYISSQLIFSLPPVPAVLGLQKEFAERMVANPGTKKYGRLSVSAQLKFRMELLQSFPPEVFEPLPKVWLSVIKLKPKGTISKGLEEFIRKIFPYPNKNTNTVLKLLGLPQKGPAKKIRQLSPKEVVDLWKSIGKNINPQNKE